MVESKANYLRLVEPESKRGYRPDNERIRTMVLETLNEKEESVRSYMATELTRDIYQLHEPDERMAHRALQRLVKWEEKAVPALVNCFKLTRIPGLATLGGVEGVDDQYAIVLTQIGAPATEGLINGTNSKDKLTKLRSINALGRIGGDPARIVPVLLDIVERTAKEKVEGGIEMFICRSDFIGEAGQALKRMEGVVPMYQDRVMALLTNPNNQVKAIGYQLLPKFVEAGKAVPVLMEFLTNSKSQELNNRIQKVKERKQGHITKENYSEISSLMNELGIEKNLEEGAIQALASYGKQDTRVVPFLIKKSIDNEEFGETASQYLGPKTGDAEMVIPAMLEELKKPEGAWNTALSILENYGTAAQEAVPMIIDRIEKLKVEDGGDRSCWKEIYALAYIAPEITGPLRHKMVEVITPLIKRWGSTHEGKIRERLNMGPSDYQIEMKKYYAHMNKLR